jgi:lysophospholipase L1-like esterase
MGEARGEEALAIRVACVGDSITFGQGIEDREHNCYPAVLGRLLGDGYHVENFGVSGTTLLRKGDFPYWSTQEFNEIPEFGPDIVIIMLGTNDSKPLNWWRHKKDFKGDLQDMVDFFSGLSTKPKVWLCLPPPIYRILPHPNDCAVRKDIIPLIRKVAVEKQLPVIDVHRAMEGRPELFPDNVHPSAEGADVIAKVVYQALVREDGSE